MGARGPKRAPSSVAAQRQGAATAGLKLPAEPFAGKAPTLPKTYHHSTWDNVEQVHHSHRVTFLPTTRRWYDEWAKSRQAHCFLPSDWRRLRMLAPIVDQYERTGRPGLLADIDRHEAKLGATIGDRQRLEMTAPPASSEAAGPGATVRRLHAVDPRSALTE